MKNEFSICGLSAECGKKVQGFVKVLDTKTEMPVTIINGKNEGKTILITAGIHGCEYPCIQTAIELAKEIDPSRVSGQIIIVHPVNTQGFMGRNAAIVPEDNKNINRVFPGNSNGTISDKIAYVITHEFQDRADFYFDLHGGDLHEALHPYIYYPGVGADDVIEKSKEIAEQFNLDYMVRSTATTGAYNSAAIRGIPSVLIERGGCGLCRREDVDCYKKDMINALNILGVLDIPKIKDLENNIIKDKKSPYEIKEVKYVDAFNDGCLEMFVKAGDKISKNQKLCVVTDFFGNIIDTYYAEFDGVVLYNTVAFSITKDSSVIAYGKI